MVRFLLYFTITAILNHIQLACADSRGNNLWARSFKTCCTSRIGHIDELSGWLTRIPQEFWIRCWWIHGQFQVNDKHKITNAPKKNTCLHFSIFSEFLPYFVHILQVFPPCFHSLEPIIPGDPGSVSQRRCGWPWARGLATRMALGRWAPMATTTRSGSVPWLQKMPILTMEIHGQVKKNAHFTHGNMGWTWGCLVFHDIFDGIWD